MIRVGVTQFAKNVRSAKAMVMYGKTRTQKENVCDVEEKRTYQFVLQSRHCEFCTYRVFCMSYRAGYTCLNFFSDLP